MAEASAHPVPVLPRGAPFDPAAYRDPAVVARLRESIAELAGRVARPVKLMHICGTHEHEIGRYALRDLLPSSVTVLAGPGCPVCVCDAELIDTAIRLSLMPEVTLASYGDMLAVPGGIPLARERGGDVRMSLLDARAKGADVRTVTSVFDVVRLARAHPEREVVFYSVGFETTVVAVAAAILRGVPPNFSMVEANYYTPPATGLLPELGGFDVDGFILPGHATTITGTRVYEDLARRGIACAVGGFEPVDVLASVAALLEQIASGNPRVVNTYARLVKRDGNERAKRELAEVFELAPARWRGIGELPGSGYRLRERYRHLSASDRFAAALADAAARGGTRSADHPVGCRCAEVTLGQVPPDACPAFATRCTPDNPYGPCMVSHEGTCRAWFIYGMHREPIHVETV